MVFSVAQSQTEKSCYEANLDYAEAEYLNGNYKNAYQYYKQALECPYLSRYNNGQAAKDGMDNCLPVLTIDGMDTLEIYVGPESGERTFNVMSKQLRMWLIDGSYHKQGVDIDTKDIKISSFRATWNLNPNNQPRNMKIHLYGVDGVNDIDAYVIIHQTAGGMRVNGKTSLSKTMNSNGDCCFFEITGLPNNAEYYITGIENIPWCKVQQQEKRLFVLLSQNPLDQMRECCFVVHHAQDSIPIIIKQRALSYPQQVGKIHIGNLKINKSSILPIRVNGKKGYTNSEGEILGLDNYYIVEPSRRFSRPDYAYCRQTGTYRINPYCQLEVLMDSTGRKYNEVKLVSSDGNILRSYTREIKEYKGDFSFGIHVFEDEMFTLEIPLNKHINRGRDERKINQRIEYFSADGRTYDTIDADYVEYNEECMALLQNWEIYDKHKRTWIWGKEWSIYDRRNNKMNNMPKDVWMIEDISDGVVLFEYVTTKKNPVGEGMLLPLYGYCDLEGNIFIKKKFLHANPFSEGYALVTQGNGLFFIDMAGNECFGGKKIWRGRSFSEGLAAVYGDDYGYTPLFIDKNGNVKITIEFAQYFENCIDDYNIYGDYEFSCGVAKILNNYMDYEKHSYCWLVDTCGNKIIDTLFENATEMICGLAGYKLNGRWGIIDKKGIIVLDHNDYRFAPRYNDPMFFNADGTVSIISSSNAITVDSIGNKFYGDVSQYVKIDQSSNNRICRFSVSALYGFYDSILGKIICNPIYDDAQQFSEDYAAVKTGAKWGFIDAEGNQVIPTAFDAVEPFENGFSVVTINGEKYRINKDGTLFLH